jgi:hypothetical protein
MNKSLIGLIGSAMLTLFGAILRLNAHAMAWPRQFSYSGPASDTIWGRQEVAIGQIGMALMFAGILIFVVTYLHWLFDKSQTDENALLNSKE